MPTSAALQREYDEKKAAGVHHNKREMRDLYRRIQEAKKAEAGDAQTSGDPIIEGPPETETAPMTMEEAFGFTLPPLSPPGSDEWRFIEKCCSEIHTPKGGITTGLAKSHYNELRARITLWRIARSIHRQIGDGGAWPQWSQLNRNNSTGEPLPPEKIKPEPAAAEPAAEPVPTETTEGMPVQPRPTEQQILSAVTGGMPPGIPGPGGSPDAEPAVVQPVHASSME